MAIEGGVDDEREKKTLSARWLEGKVNERTFNWNLSEERDKCNWVNYRLPFLSLCVVFSFVPSTLSNRCQNSTQLEVEHSGHFQSPFEGITSASSSSSSHHRFSFHGKDYVFTIIKMKVLFPTPTAALSEGSSWQPTTSRRFPTLTSSSSSHLRAFTFDETGLVGGGLKYAAWFYR